MFKKTIIATVSFLLFSFTAFAYDGNEDFSGEWKLDKEKTDLSGNQLILAKITVTHKGNSLLTSRTYENDYGEQYPFEENLSLDGKESNIIIYDMPRKTTALRSEDGESLIITSTIKYYGDTGEEEFSVEETWSLKEKGKWLSIDFTTNSSRGTNKGTYFFKKVER